MILIEEVNFFEFFNCSLCYSGSVYCCKSSEDFVSCWYGNNYCCWCKVCSCVNVYSYCKYVMRSYRKSQWSNCYDSKDYSQVYKCFLLSSFMANDVRDYIKSWQNEKHKGVSLFLTVHLRKTSPMRLFGTEQVIRFKNRTP